jgi:ketosteroid isomerase-like protein
MSTTTPADVVLRYYAAINARDWAAYDQLFTADCELLATGSEPMSGVDAVRAFDEAYVSVFPDLRIDSERRFVAGDTVVSENTGGGTMLGPLPTPMGMLPPTGEQGRVPYVGVFTVVGDRITSQRIYLDRAAILESTGALAAAAS